MLTNNVLVYTKLIQEWKKAKRLNICKLNETITRQFLRLHART